MCCNTKRKIADGVMLLMKKKPIQRVTVQDIMEQTNMRRQSFYYHFKDVYDVLEWIYAHDVEEGLEDYQEEGFEDWAFELLHILDENKGFYRKVVNEIPWSRIIERMKPLVEERIRSLVAEGSSLSEGTEEELAVTFLSYSFSYYVLDYVSRRRHVDAETLTMELNTILRLTGNYNASKRNTVYQPVAF